MRRELCLCEEARACRQSLRPRIRVVILQHHREKNLSTNTARLAGLALPNCEIRLRGLPEQPIKTDDLSMNSLLLYPCEGSKPLSEVALPPEANVTLIVPDGSWRQASKVAAREPALNGVPRVYLPEGVPTRYFLRREPKAGGLATFEAIARALGILEGDEVQAKLEALFALMVERTLKSRGTPLPFS